MELPNKEKLLEFVREKKKLLLILGGVVVFVIFSSLFSKEKEENKKEISWKIGGKEVTSDSVSVGKVSKSSLTDESNQDSEEVITTPTPFNKEKQNELAYLDELDSQDISTPKKRSQPSQSSTYSPYGTYDMWENKEPANSKIGYSDKKWKQPIPQEKYKEAPISSQTEASDLEEIATPNYQKPQKSLATAKQIPASLISSGYATDGSKVTLVLLEPTSIAGQQVKKGQAISGTIKEENGRMLVDVQTININKKIYQVNIKVLAEDGIEGIYIGGGKSKNSRLGESAREAGGQEASNAVSRIPVVGGVLGSVISRGSRRDSGQEPIKLNPGTRAIVVIY